MADVRWKQMGSRARLIGLTSACLTRLPETACRRPDDVLWPCSKDEALFCVELATQTSAQHSARQVPPRECAFVDDTDLAEESISGATRVSRDGNKSGF